MLLFSIWTQAHEFFWTQMGGNFFIFLIPWVHGPWQAEYLFLWFLWNSFFFFKPSSPLVSLPFAFYLYFFSWLILSVSRFDSKVNRADRAIGVESWGGPRWSFSIKSPFRGFPFYLLSCRCMEGMNKCTATSLHPTFLICWRAADIIFSQHCVPWD